MGSRYFIICDSEPFYASRLADNLSEKMIDFEIHVCSSIGQIQNLEKNGLIYILLIEDQFSLEERNKVSAKHKFVITRQTEEELDISEKSIYKYQSSDNIFDEIMKECLEQNENILCSRVCRTNRMIGVYSPVGRTGKTTFAIAMGKELAKQEKVLYLNLETYSGWKEIFKTDSQYSLADLLYYVKQDRGNLGIRMEMMTEHLESLDYIMPIPISRDLKEVSFEEWKEFLTALMNYSIYKTIIIDFGECVQGLWELLQMCTEIYFPICTDTEAAAKISQFENNMKLLGYDKLIGRINKIIIEKDIDNFVKKLIKKEEKRCVTGGAAS